MERIALPEAAELPSDSLLSGRTLPEHDRRRHRRVSVDLTARMVLPDGSEADGRLISISAGGAEVTVPHLAPIGKTVVAYVDRLGRLEGQVLRPTRDGFVITFSTRARRARRLADALTWITNMGPERDRRGARRYARDEAATLLRDGGDAVACRILDISTTGASVAIEAHERPPIGEAVTIGVMDARVVRHHEAGIGLAFANPARKGGADAPAPTAQPTGEE